MEKGKRRSRKDVEGREHMCPCGKQYLSYPALYTHIKTKHDGLKPEEIEAIKQMTCNDAFEEFLKEKEGLQKYENVIGNLKSCLNDRGFQMEREISDQDYCSVRSPYNIPNISNYFLLKYLPFKMEKPNTEEAIQVTQVFCEWLYRKKYTKISLKRNIINKDQ